MPIVSTPSSQKDLDSAVDQFQRDLARHVASMVVSIADCESTRHQVFTGFLVKSAHCHYWVTARHCVSELILALKQVAQSGSQVLRIRDGIPGDDRSGVPIDTGNLQWIAPRDTRIDMAALKLEQHVVDLILADPRSRFVELCEIDGSTLSKNDYAWMLGWPGELVEVRQENRRPHLRVHFSSNLAICPVSLDVTDDLEGNAGHFYRYSADTAMFGRVDSAAIPFKNVSGMSGGPLFRLVVENGKALGCAVAGVVSQWLRPTGHVRFECADSIHRIDEDWPALS